MARPSTIEPAHVLKALSHTPARPSELATRLGASRATVHRKLEVLLAQGLVVRVGEGPVAAYRLPSVAEELAKAQAERASEGQVRLVLTHPMAQAMQSSLELFSRIGIGQLSEVASRVRFLEIKHADGSSLSYAEMDEVDQLCDALKHHLLGLEGNASFGIYSPKVHPSVLRSWALQRAIRHRLAWDHRPEGSMAVLHDEPLGIDSIAGLFVHSDQPDTSGQPTRYIIEMPSDCVALLIKALTVSLRVGTGDVGAVVDLAREQLLRSESGEPVSESALAHGEVIARRLNQVLSGVEGGGAFNVELSPRQAEVLQVLKALERFVETQAEVRIEGPLALLVTKVQDSPWAVNLEELPEGMLLNYRGGKYRVIAPTGEDQMLTLVAESHSLKTALQMAKNRAAGREGRNFSM